MRIGVAVTDLGPTQLNYFLISNTNLLAVARRDIDLIAFYENLARPCLAMNFSIMQLVEAWGYDGTIIATNLSTADKILRFPGTNRKLFYVWDLEWLRIQQPHFETLQKIYGSPKLQLISRSEEHARVLQAAWNRDVLAISPDFDLDKIIPLCHL